MTLGAAVGIISGPPGWMMMTLYIIAGVGAAIAGSSACITWIEERKQGDQVTVDEVRALFVEFKRAKCRYGKAKNALHEVVENEGIVARVKERLLRQRLQRIHDDAAESRAETKMQYDNGMKALMAQRKTSRHECFQLIVAGDEQLPVDDDRPSQVQFAEKTKSLTPNGEEFTGDTDFTLDKPKPKKRKKSEAIA
jgi:hypothetical protein